MSAPAPFGPRLVPSTAPGKVREAAGHRLSVLLTEDDRADALLVEELISDADADIRCRWARSMADANRELTLTRPDCVLLDLGLPDANGIHALQHIRERAPGIDVTTRYVSSREHALLGGDFYDIVQTPDRTVHLTIGDVAGHGPDAAALGVALRIAGRALLFAGLRGPDRMRELDRVLCTERADGGIFATVLSLAIAPEECRVDAIRAGHPGMMIHGEGRVEWLEPPGGPALGLASGEWENHQMHWPQGTGLVLFTDGLFEGHAGHGDERLGEDGLLQMARSLARLPGPRFVDALIDEAAQRARAHGGLTDDVAVVRVERSTG